MGIKYMVYLPVASPACHGLCKLLEAKQVRSATWGQPSQGEDGGSDMAG